eukprot:6794837-Prymnesium_polylepis.2
MVARLVVDLAERRPMVEEGNVWHGRVGRRAPPLREVADADEVVPGQRAHRGRHIHALPARLRHRHLLPIDLGRVRHGRRGQDRVHPRVLHLRRPSPDAAASMARGQRRRHAGASSPPCDT